MAVLLLVLTLIDGAITVVLLDHGYDEANPVMRALLDGGVGPFFSGKYVLTAAFLPVALVLHRYRLFGTRFRVGQLVPVVVGLYVVLIVYQCALSGATRARGPRWRPTLRRLHCPGGVTHDVGHQLTLVVLGLGLGMSVGSFLNVCIWRLPRGESVIRPRSRCPSCGTPIRVPRQCAGPGLADARGPLPLLRLEDPSIPVVEASVGVLLAGVVLADLALDPFERGNVGAFGALVIAGRWWPCWSP